MGKNDRLYQVDLTLTNDNDPDLRALTDRIGQEIEGINAWDRLGYLLLQMNQSKKAEQIYKILVDHFLPIILIWLLPTTTSVMCIPTWVNIRKHFRLTKKHLQFDNNHFLRIILIWLIPTTTSVRVYYNMGDYSKALSSHEKALAIRQQSLPPNHPDLASSYNNIGNGVFTAWVTIRKHFRLTKKHLQFDNNHFLRIILIWVLPTTTSVMCIETWVTIRKHFRLTKKHLQFNNNHFLRIILIWLFLQQHR